MSRPPTRQLSRKDRACIVLFENFHDIRGPVVVDSSNERDRAIRKERCGVRKLPVLALPACLK